MIPTATRSDLISQLEASQHELTALLTSVADQQDWQPAGDMWSFRYHAAHLVATDREAFWVRVQRLASGERPFFEHYLNSGRDFSQLDLRDSLKEWTAIRRQILDFVLALPEDKLTLTGTHATFGQITVLDVLRVMLDHDREHLEELRGYAAAALSDQKN